MSSAARRVRQHRILRAVAARQVLPGRQADCGTPDSVLVEQVRNRVGKIRAGPRRAIGSRRRGDVPQGKLVGDDERDWRVPGVS